MSLALNILVGTVVLGSIYGLIALGFVYIFRSTGVINFAHGQFLTLAAWMTLSFAFLTLSGIGAVVACVATGVVAVIVYRTVVRAAETYGRFVAVIATMGVAFMLEGLMLLVWGPSSQSLALLPDGTIRFREGSGVSVANVIVVAIGLCTYAAIVIADRRFVVGMQMRAAAANRLLASQLGIHVGRLFSGAWFVAGVLAAIAGICYAATTLVSPQLSSIGLAGLPAALVGGFDSVEGALPGGLLVALVVVLTSTFVSSAGSFAATYLLLLLFVMLRPQGLLGSTVVDRV
jgi:branched-chain amino acid transport system permease protein